MLTGNKHTMHHDKCNWIEELYINHLQNKSAKICRSFCLHIWTYKNQQQYKLLHVYSLYNHNQLS